MTEMKEVTRKVEVPASAGVDGFLHAIREIVKQPLVQRIVMEANGRVSYTVLQDEEEEGPVIGNVGIDFGKLEPYAVIRNSDAQELSYPPSLGACDVITAMFDAVTESGFHPICFVVGMDSLLWNWLHFTSGVELKSREALCGYPVYTDRQLPETVLVLCAGVGHTRALVDTQLSVKVEMQQNPVLNDDMEII